MDWSRILTVLSEFEQMLAHNFEVRASGLRDEYIEGSIAIRRRLPAIVEIARSVAPDMVRAGRLLEDHERGWSWRHVRPAVQELTGMVRDRDELEAILGPEGPRLSAKALHPGVWGAAAQLWDAGHRREAVQGAATFVELELRAKIERADLSGKDLASQAFTLDSPKPGACRLRFDDLPPGSAEWTSMHEGAQAFGRGCFQAIRNIATHLLDQPSEEEALESLAALSILARWVDRASVERGPQANP